MMIVVLLQENALVQPCHFTARAILNFLTTVVSSLFCLGHPQKQILLADSVGMQVSCSDDILVLVQLTSEQRQGTELKKGFTWS